MYEKTRDKPCGVTVVVKNPIKVHVTERTQLPVVKVLVPGIQGPSASDKPLEIDPLETYLKARGDFPNGDDDQ